MSVKNGAAFLPEALDSILAQSYEDWELIVVDNFSSDEVPAILKTYAERDARIQVHASEKDDLISALNQAYLLANGRFLTRMDADDRMTPGRLERMTEALLNAQAMGDSSVKYIATGLVRYFSANGIADGFRRYEEWLNELTKASANFSGIYKECSIASPCWMIEISSVSTNYLYEEKIYPEDYNLCFRFYGENFRVIGIPELLLEWRDHGARASRTEDNYADHTFLDLKIHSFLSVDRNKETRLILWGAGKKGKFLAKKIIEENIPFDWICDNPQKIGKDIYGVLLKGVEEIGSGENAQMIIVVAGPKDQEEIQQYLDLHQKRNNIDYFWFC